MNVNGHDYGTRIRNEFIGAANPTVTPRAAQQYTREESARTLEIHADVIVPLLQSIITGVIASIPIGGLLIFRGYSVWWVLPLSFIAVAAMWCQGMVDSRRQMFNTERVEHNAPAPVRAEPVREEPRPYSRPVRPNHVPELIKIMPDPVVVDAMVRDKDNPNHFRFYDFEIPEELLIFLPDVANELLNNPEAKFSSWLFRHAGVITEGAFSTLSDLMVENECVTVVDRRGSKKLTDFGCKFFESFLRPEDLIIDNNTELHTHREVPFPD